MSPRQGRGSPQGPATGQGRQGDRPAQPGAAERKAEALRAAASSRHAEALARADNGLRKLVKDDAEINFRAVARASAVSLNFLYEQPELRRRIESLRSQQRAATPASRPRPEAPDQSSPNNMVRVLAGQLKAERARHLEQTRELEERLAAAHAEILRLTRALASTRGTTRPERERQASAESPRALDDITSPTRHRRSAQH
jgi:hypothetical protein